jgi:hypothetical protein
MSRFPLSIFIGFLVLVRWASVAVAQEATTADALLTRAYETLHGLPHVEVTVTIRNVQTVNPPSAGGPAGAGEPRVLGAAYQRVQVTRRQPEDWRVVSLREREMNGQVQPERKVVVSKVGAGDATVLVLNVSTREPSPISIPAELFRQEVLERAGAALRSDPVLKAFLFDRENVGAMAHGLPEATVAGPDEAKGLRLTRLSANVRGARWTVWIDDATGLIVRSLMVQPGGGTAFRSFTETLYAYDFLRGDVRGDFDAREGWNAAGEGIAASSAFAPVGEVLAQIGAPGVLDGPGIAGEPRAPSLRPATGAEAGGGAPGAVVARAPGAQEEAQLLTPTQMESIVLVEGDEGAGSGFITRMRGVEFVVTNLHVIGGNANIRVTTLRGAPVKVGAMFGAAGRDIALLRIEGGHAGPVLELAEDPVKTAKIGDKVAVVGNRRGGGVATQVSGVVRGIGPDRLEVDAPFQPGNSGSPIVHVASGEVLGVASYAQVRRLDELDEPTTPGATGARADARRAGEERRWFGYRADGVAKWEAIDLVKWRAQAKRVSDFEADSEAIYHAMNGRFRQASVNPRVRVMLDRFEERVNRSGGSQTIVMQEVHELFRGLRALGESGAKDLRNGEFYDYFRTSLYWETSIPEQLRAREELVRRLDRASENATAFLAKLRR